jgi:hypothetical protein
MWSALLEENGIAVVPVDGARVTLRRGSQCATYTVVTTSARVHPSEVREPPAGNALLIAPALSEAAALRARSSGWSAIPDDGPAWVLFHGREIKLDRPHVADGSEQHRRPGRPGWGIFSVLRALLALEGGARQSELADFAKVSQPRISQVLSELATLDLVERSPSGWAVTDNAEVITWWVDHYPGPGGLVSHWYGLDPVVEQAFRVHELLGAKGLRPAVSGDVAADLVVPWRTPTQALVYAEKGADLAAAGLTPAAAEDATLTLVLPADCAVWPIGHTPWTVGLTGYGNVARAGALQVLHDLKHASGPDADDAAQAWLDWMLSADPVV